MLAPCTITEAIVDLHHAQARHVRQQRLRRSPAVTTNRLNPCTLCPTWHLTDVSETQSVVSPVGACVNPIDVCKSYRCL